MIPIKLIMENFISHTKSEIDFNQFDVALIVGVQDNNPSVSNGAGKTSIFDAIRFALYNKTRFNMKEKVVKRGKLKCRVEFIFSVSDETYKIVRLFNKKTGIGDVEFFKKEGDVWLSETCDTPTSTTQKIMDIVGMSHDTFVSSVCFKQNDIAGFAGASATKRKEILKEVLQIGIWDEFQEEAKENEKELSKKKQALEQRISEIGNIEEEKTNAELELNKINDLLKSLEESSVVCQKDLNSVGEQIMKLELEIAKGNHIDKSSLEKRLLAISKRAKDIKELKESYKQEVNKNNDIIAKAASSCDSLEKKLISLAKDVLPVDHRHRDKAKQICKEDINVLYGQQSLSDKRGQKEALQKELNTFETHLSQINYLEPGKECPICLTELKNLSKVCELRNIKKNSLKINIDEKKKEIAELNSLITKEEKAIKKADDSIVEIERTELMISKLMASQTEAQRKNEEILNQNASLTSEWNGLKEEKENITSIISSNTIDIRSEIDNLISKKSSMGEEVKRIRDKMLSLSVEQGGLKNKLENIDRRISEKASLVSQKNQVSSSSDVYTKLAKAFGKDGIQAIIMENITEDLKNFANSVLETICSDNMTIDFVTQTKTTTGNWKEDFEIVITTDGNTLEFDDLSGGEQVRVAIAIRMAIGQLLMQRVGSDIRFLLLDEVDQALDAHGIEALSDAIQALSKDFKILVITHNESIKERFTNIITVVKQASGSIIRQ